MPIHPRKQAIFEAWFEFEYSAGEDEKAAKKQIRNELILQILRERGLPDTGVTDFLREFRDDYREWLNSERLRLQNRRRF